MHEDHITAATRRWVERFVVGFNLCPFARRELERGRVRFRVCGAQDEEQLLGALQDELQRLLAHDDIETTLLIHPQVLQEFFAYNQFLDDGERLLRAMGLEGIFQIASFHPQYQFAGTAPDDAENFSNRSPFPMLHLLREDSVERAVTGYPDVDQIPRRNIAMLNAEGAPRLAALWQACIDE